MVRTLVRLATAAILLSPMAFAQTAEEQKVWRDFMEAAKADPSQLNIKAYRAKLVQAGTPEAQADERIKLIGKLYETYPKFKYEAQAVGFNHVYRDPKQTRFTYEPSAFLAAMTKDLKPGKALDVAMGQGRNVLYLASKGWDVTGFDLAEEGLKVAQAAAAKAGTPIKTVYSGWDDFDFGKDQWDLICFIYTDAPVMKPEFVARVIQGLKPGGLLLMDRPYRSLINPEPGWKETEADKPNAWLKAWGDLIVVHYEDKTGVGDWQQTATRREEYKDLRLLKMLARKR
jgi:2-polyprenyl-3-methyl-5-hydroxy-6-metoxy-1,4-benzoquinol methylase